MKTPNETADRLLFDRIADKYEAKDRHPASSAARRHRLRRTLDIAGISVCDRILEVGCGTGVASSYLEGRYREYVGIDHSEEMIRIADRRHAGPGIRFEAVSAEEFSGEGGLDVILMIGVLHHMEMPRESLRAMRRLLAPGGHLVVNEPQPANPLIRMARSVRRRLDGAYSDEQVEFTAAELEDLFIKAGLERCEIKAQGVLSTPFAEVILRPAAITAPLSRLACRADRTLEGLLGGPAMHISWNLVGHAREPENNS